MTPENASVSSTPIVRLPWILLARWTLGLYLLAGSVMAALILKSSWQHLSDMSTVYPNLNLYPMLIACGCKFLAGVLLLCRSKWLLVAVPVWISVFLYDLLSRNTFRELPAEFFLAVALQGCILSFVIWLHSRGGLK